MSDKPAPRTLLFQGDDDFLKEVRGQVVAALDGRALQGDPRLHRKGLVIGIWFAASYGLLLAIQEPRILQLALCVSYAFAACALAFNVFHDANHGAWSTRSSVNLAISRLTCIVLGPARFFWRHKHQVLHHHAPNVFKWDDDVESRGFLRLSPEQSWHPRYRYQLWFFGPLYACNSFEWVFVKDFAQYFTGRMNAHVTLPRLSTSDHVEFWLCKAAHIGMFVLLPMAFHPVVDVLVGLALAHVVMSLLLTIVFQLAHLNDRVAFHRPDDTLCSIANKWGAHQLRTTMNFGTQSRRLNWFTGGLNFQIEHHLFPRLSHTYYPEISGIVRRVAGDYGLPYTCIGSLRAAIASHFRLVRRLAAAPTL